MTIKNQRLIAQRFLSYTIYKVWRHIRSGKVSEKSTGDIIKLSGAYELTEKIDTFVAALV
ncbi:hypothetical protein FACS1894159_00070 [Bacteroidia bacterium]|nr:hypothetical protein FACS1894159_00070 [Bacteroidia bacterium]